MYYLYWSSDHILTSSCCDVAWNAPAIDMATLESLPPKACASCGETVNLEKNGWVVYPFGERTLAMLD